MNVKVVWGALVPFFQIPSGVPGGLPLIEVCPVMGLMLVHVTVSPWVIFNDAGVNKKLFSETVQLAAGAACRMRNRKPAVNRNITNLAFFMYMFCTPIRG